MQFNQLFSALIGLVLCLMMPQSSDGRAEDGVSAQPPNVILIMTDDQGFGDFGFQGNPVIQTPNLDLMYQCSMVATNFYVCPVCAPTRACLMTGRYNYRTGVVDTYQGRAMMRSNETTIAEILKDNGYATGIFGKWHLGDCYPMRPQDQGFQRSVVHRGGGIGQSSDPLDAQGKYTNPILVNDGQLTQYKGYCTDVYYREAMKFIEKKAASKKPFFVYLPDNCPHGPFRDVPAKWYEKYRAMDLSRSAFPKTATNPMPEKENLDQRARIFSMISNVDENIGRLQKKLKALKIAENTIVLFLTDNGPNGQRFVKGLRGMKTSVYQGGIRTPLLLQWPAQSIAGQKIPHRLAHIDLLPTLCELCGIEPPANLNLDGLSFASSIVDSSGSGNFESKRRFEKRVLYIQSHRGNTPQRYHHFAAISSPFKLVRHSGFGRQQLDTDSKFELYNLQDDPGETKNVASEFPQTVKQMKRDYDRWFDDVTKTNQQTFDETRIIVGTQQQNPVHLTRQDARAIPGNQNQVWYLKTEQSAAYKIHCYFRQKDERTKRIELIVNQKSYFASFDKKSQMAHFEQIVIPVGAIQMTARTVPIENEKPATVYQIQVDRIN